MLEPVYCVLSVHIKEPQVVRVSGALPCVMPHNGTIVLACKIEAIMLLPSVVSICSLYCFEVMLENFDEKHCLLLMQEGINQFRISPFNMTPEFMT